MRSIKNRKKSHWHLSHLPRGAVSDFEPIYITYQLALVNLGSMRQRGSDRIRLFASPVPLRYPLHVLITSSSRAGYENSKAECENSDHHRGEWIPADWSGFWRGSFMWHRTCTRLVTSRTFELQWVFSSSRNEDRNIRSVRDGRQFSLPQGSQNFYDDRRCSSLFSRPWSGYHPSSLIR